MTKNKRFNVTFTTKDKYHPTTRTLEVETLNEMAAGNLISSEFDTWTMNKKLHTYFPSGKRITIDKIEEIKDDSNNS